MYQFLYSEIVQDEPGEARRREREAFDTALVLMLKAEPKGTGSLEAIRALHFLQQLWSILIDDLCNKENDLPATIKAGLISIGLWVGREIDSLRSARVTSFASLIEINQMVRDGLK